MNPIFENGFLNPEITKPSQLVQLCIQSVNKKQANILRKYHLDKLKAFSVNEKTSTIRFILEDETTHEYEVIPAGIWNSKENVWIWAWSNSEKGTPMYAKSLQLKNLQNVITAEDFRNPVIKCEAQLSQALSCIATEFLGGVGRFVAPNGDFRVHFVLIKKKPNRKKKTSAEEVVVEDLKSEEENND